MLTVAIVFGALSGAAACILICATMLSSRRHIVVPPEQGTPFDEYDGDGNLRKRVPTRNADAWREEYAAAMRLRDGMGRR